MITKRIKKSNNFCDNKKYPTQEDFFYYILVVFWLTGENFNYYLLESKSKKKSLEVCVGYEIV